MGKSAKISSPGLDWILFNWLKFNSNRKDYEKLDDFYACSHLGLWRKRG